MKVYFDTTNINRFVLDVHPPEAQVNSLKELISCSLERNKLSKNYRVIGHRQGKDTDCPGDKLYSEVKRLHNWDSDPS